MTDPAAAAAEPELQDAEPSRTRDWTDGGKKPERAGPKCANPACQQVLMIVRDDRRYCALCDREAGRDPHEWQRVA